MFGHHGRKRSSKEGMWIGKKKREVVEKGRMWIGKKREVVEKGRDVLGGAQGPVRSQLKSERFCGKGAKERRSAARPARPPEGRRADAHAERRERDNEQQMPGQASL